MGAVDNEHRWPQSPSRNSGCVLWLAVTLTQLTNWQNNRQKSTETIRSNSIYSSIEIEDLTWPFWSVWRSERHQTSRWSAARQALVLEMNVSKAYDAAKRFVRSRWIIAACLCIVISAVPKVWKVSECFRRIWRLKHLDIVDHTQATLHGTGGQWICCIMLHQSIKSPSDPNHISIMCSTPFLVWLPKERTSDKMSCKLFESPGRWYDSER